MVDFIGPQGLDKSAVNTGRIKRLGQGAVEGVTYCLRESLPMVEIKVPFRIKLSEIEALARGAADVDTDPLIEASLKIAQAEDEIIFNGLEEANIKGIAVEAAESAYGVSDKDGFMPAVVQGISGFKKAGVGGPYSLLLGPEMYASLFKSTGRGYPEEKRLNEILEGNIIRVPTLESRGLLISTRGGDFELFGGQDLSVGFSHWKEDEIEFFLYESLTFRINTPEAALILT